MSASHNSSRFLDDWWPLFLILFGILFVSFLVSFHPFYWRRCFRHRAGAMHLSMALCRL